MEDKNAPFFPFEIIIVLEIAAIVFGPHTLAHQASPPQLRLDHARAGSCRIAPPPRVSTFSLSE